MFAELLIKQGKQINNKPNGICQDLKGNFYVAHYGMRQVQALNFNGHLLYQYSSANLIKRNSVFGGLNQDYLFVTRKKKVQAPKFIYGKTKNVFHRVGARNTGSGDSSPQLQLWGSYF